MATGMLTLSCLLVAVGANPTDVWPINQRSFSVPIKIEPDRKQEIKELVLYSSSDQGKTWSQQAVATPDKESFPFYAPSDGVHWLSLVIVDRKGNRDPVDVYQAPPSRKVLVDTLKPVVRITAAERQGDDIVVGWEIQEEHPDLTSLKLEYRGGDLPSHPWYTAPLIPAMTGQTRFHSPGTGAVSVRLHVKDLAENFNTATAEIPGLPPSPGAPTVPTAVAVAPAPAGPTPYLAPTQPVPPAPPPYTPPATNPWDTSLNSTLIQNRQKPADAPYSPIPASRYQPVNVADNPRVLAATDQIAPASYSNGSRMPQWDKIRRQFIRNREVNLKYEVKNDGPSGIGKVELWLTNDDGRSWRKYAEDLSPAAGLMTKERTFTAELPGEGSYGLCLVVLSKAGLGKPPPQPGDAPDMRVEVDLTKPVAVLNEPEPDPSNPNSIVLSWTASDRNPAPTPVTLQWRDRVTGDWKTIADNQPLNGQYSWPLPHGLPSWVYLRLQVRDLAGNENSAETREPVLVDLSKPEAQILGIATGRDH